MVEEYLKYHCVLCDKDFDEPNIITETWEDPGDYPSGAGGYPLPSYEYKLEVCPFCDSDDFYENDEDEDIGLDLFW